ncbi:MAG: aspartate/glutamate racemase family protein, partial [Lachnospiraceae bacterium]|nr:aspartate/glutamate racemase family protein [Lachnospiraceae bacterium]
LYARYIGGISPELRVFGQACPLFVPLVEEGMRNDSVTRQMAERYLKPLLEEKIDTLVLGCTHYPLLTEVIGSVAGPSVTLVNPAFETARELGEMLTERGLLKQSDTPVTHRFFVSDGEEQFRRFANSILPCELEETDVNRKVFS